VNDNSARIGGSLVAVLVIATTQLMLVLDDSIVNIALPSVQRELSVDPVALPWVVNAYILTFGALLLVGGRAGDLWGRRRVLRLGLLIFVLASLVGGFSSTTEILVASRAIQGAGGSTGCPQRIGAHRHNVRRSRGCATRRCPCTARCRASGS